MIARSGDCPAPRNDREPREAKPRNVNGLSGPFLARFAGSTEALEGRGRTRITLIERETTDDT